MSEQHGASRFGSGGHTGLTAPGAASGALPSARPQGRAGPAWRPPAPVPRPGIVVGTWLLLRRRRDLLEFLTVDCYRRDVVPIPVGRRRVFIVNDPQAIKRILVHDRERYPKSDLMVGALRPLVGDGILVAEGERWQHDRVMLEPAFAHMRLQQMFPDMRAAVDAHLARLGRLPNDSVIDLEAELSHVTSDVIFRALFSEPIDGADAREVFGAFARFEHALPQFDLRVVLNSRPDATEPLPRAVLEEAAVIRQLIGRLVDRRAKALARGERFVDFAQAALEARDSGGRGFDREQLIDQLTVLFLAGHETTASALTWTLFLLSRQPWHLARLREEIAAALGDRPFGFGDAKALPFTRNVFREALRLYPPVAFLTRQATSTDRLGPHRVPAGSFVVVSPWLVHRHERYWSSPDRFDPDRFEARDAQAVSGAYLPFGLGPRVCTGATIAQLEAILILVEYLRRFDFEPIEPDAVMPASRVTIRPRNGIACRLRRRKTAACGEPWDH